MTRRNLLPLITMLALFAVSFAAVARQQTTYRLTHLATRFLADTNTGLSITGINNKSELVGSRLLNGVSVPFIWRDGEFHDLNLPVDTDAFALAINDRSDVVGKYGGEVSAASARCFLWRRGKVTVIQTASGQFAESLTDINNRRELVILVRGPGDVTGRFIWRNGQLTRLELLAGFEGNDHDPLKLNDRGAVVDNAFPTGPIPVLWEHGTIMQIQLPQGARNGNGEAINNRGVVIGTAFFPDAFFPERNAGHLWQDGQATELRPPRGFVNTGVLDINNRGVIVGASHNPAEPEVATIWPRRGEPVDLHTLIADDDPLKPFRTPAGSEFHQRPRRDRRGWARLTQCALG